MIRLILTAWIVSAPLAAGPGNQGSPVREAAAGRAVENAQFGEALAIYQDLSERHPDDSDYAVWAARLSRWLGDAEAAEAYLDRVLGGDPGHAEARVEKAYVRMGQQRFDEAEALLSPFAGSGDNPDAMMALARLYSYRGEDARAMDSIAEVLRAYPDHPEARELERTLAARTREHRVEIILGYGQDRLSLASPAHNAGLTVSYTGDRSRFDLSAETWDKFGNRSQRLGPSLSYRFGERLSVRGSAMWARTARVLPRQSLGTGVSWALPGGWVASADYRQLRFENPVVHVFSPSVEYYPELPAWVRVAFYRSWTHHRTPASPDLSDAAVSVQYNHQFGTRIAALVGYAWGNESYSDLSIDRVGRFDANTYTFGGTIQLADGLSTRLLFSRQGRSDGSIQHSLGVGLTIRK